MRWRKPTSSSVLFWFTFRHAVEKIEEYFFCLIFSHDFEKFKFRVFRQNLVKTTLNGLNLFLTSFCKNLSEVENLNLDENFSSGNIFFNDFSFLFIFLQPRFAILLHCLDEFCTHFVKQISIAFSTITATSKFLNFASFWNLLSQNESRKCKGQSFNPCEHRKRVPPRHQSLYISLYCLFVNFWLNFQNTADI